MDFFEAVGKRRSIRKFSEEAIPEAVMRKAFEAATLAPNSSNVQTWNFYWVRTPEKKKKLVEYCLSQSAARTAQELVVITADPGLWRRSHQPLLDWVEKANAPKPVHLYYKVLMPALYGRGLLSLLYPLKWVVSFFTGLARPMQRGPFSLRDLQEVAIKSAALGAENFVLALAAQGYATCMMEGFDEWRVRRLLRLKRTERVVMVVGIGREGPRATWGPSFRLPLEQVVHEV